MKRKPLDEEQLVTEQSSQRGAGLAEYAILLLLVAFAVFVALQTFGTTVSTTYNTITTTLFN